MFSLLIPGHPPLPPPPPLPGTTDKFAFSFPFTPFSHLVVFIVPPNTLPVGTAAGVYLQLPGEASGRFLGGLGTGKESAVYRITGEGGAGQRGQIGQGGGGGGGEVNVGISIEAEDVIQRQLQELEQRKQVQSQSQTPTSPNLNHSSLSTNTSPSLSSPTATSNQTQPTTKILAQRIIQNAFNFLSSFSGRVGENGVEVVPLKSFEEWWRKFERRVEVDPSFLERDLS